MPCAAAWVAFRSYMEYLTSMNSFTNYCSPPHPHFVVVPAQGSEKQGTYLDCTAGGRSRPGYTTVIYTFMVIYIFHSADFKNNSFVNN